MELDFLNDKLSMAINANHAIAFFVNKLID